MHSIFYNQLFRVMLFIHEKLSLGTVVVQRIAGKKINW